MRGLSSSNFVLQIKTFLISYFRMCMISLGFKYSLLTIQVILFLKRDSLIRALFQPDLTFSGDSLKTMLNGPSTKLL